MNSASSQKARVRSAWGRVKCGSGTWGVGAAAKPVGGAVAEDAGGAPPSGRWPTSSGARTISRTLGSKPTARTARPTAIQPARQPPNRMAPWAISGRQTRPTICAAVAIAVAVVRRAMNQLFTAP